MNNSHYFHELYPQLSNHKLHLYLDYNLIHNIFLIYTLYIKNINIIIIVHKKFHDVQLSKIQHHQIKYELSFKILLQKVRYYSSQKYKSPPMESDLIAMMGNLKVSSKFQFPNIIPYEGIQGKWVVSKQFNSISKTFGFYQCNYCQKTWMSAHSKKSFKQGCKDCKRFFYPTHLWVNQQKKHIEKKPLKDNEKPHLTHLCEACKKGKCLR